VSPLPSRSRRLLFGLGVAAALLGTAELALRLALGPTPPPVRVYTVVAPGEGAFVEDNGFVRATYVEVDPPPPVPARPSGPRWVALGASSVHGGTMGVNRPDEFAALAASRAGVEVLNLATPGLDSYDLLNLTNQLAVFEPTGVIVYEGHNDVGNAWFQARFGAPEALAEAKVGALLARLRLFVELRRGLLPVEGKGRVRGHQGATRGYLTAEARDRAERYFAINLGRIAWRCAQEGWRLVLVTPVSNIRAEPTRLPDGANDAAIASWHEGTALAATNPEKAVVALRTARDRDVIGLRASTRTQDDVRRVAAETGATLVDADRLLPREPGMDTPAASLFSDPLHLSREGHVAMGALVGDAIRP